MRTVCRCQFRSIGHIGDGTGDDILVGGLLTRFCEYRLRQQLWRDDDFVKSEEAGSQVIALGMFDCGYPVSRSDI